MFGHQRIWSFSVTLLFCVLLIPTNFYPWLSELNLNILFKLRGDRPTSQSIVIVGIDEVSLQKYGPWPFSRSIHASLLGRLKEAKVIGFDLLFTHSTPEDGALVAAIKKNPPVVMAVATDYHRNVLKPYSRFIESVQLGHIETQRGSDGILRRTEFYKYDLPVLSLAMAFAGKEIDKESAKQNSVGVINFYGPEFTFLYLSFDDVLNGKYNVDFFRDRYVLVGSRAIALGDVHITPFSRQHPVPGVEIQATILNNLLADEFLRPMHWLVWCFVFGAVFLSLVVWHKNSEVKNFIITVLFALFAMACGVSLFEHNYFFNSILPVFILLVAYLFHFMFWWLKITAGMINELRELDGRLVQGVDKVFMTLPASLRPVRKKNTQPRLMEGFSQHISHLHSGIQALGLQGEFINHLLSEETPPLILWQMQSGEIILANNRFFSEWKSTLGMEKALPQLEDFYALLNENRVTDTKSSPSQDINSKAVVQSDCTVDILTVTGGKKSYYRVVIHHVVDSILGFDGILASLTDVTEIRELERLKGEIMNIVSHELKLPLTTIMGFSEMLSDSVEGKEKQFALQIHEQSSRLAKMIEDFLDIARIESGKYVIYKHPFDLLSVIHDAASCVMHSGLQKNIRMSYALPEKLSPLIGDESLITQAILNLIDNAIKFSPENTEIQVQVSEREEVIIVTVEDGGRGITDVDKEAIFKKFNRGSGQVNEKGFGLGLSFVHEVVENHAGSISVSDSDRLGGAKFTITLPKSQ